MEEKVITTREAAERLGVGLRTVARGVHLGMLRAKWGGLCRNRIVGIYEDSVAQLIATKQPPTCGGYETREIHPKGGAR